ncbi:hypothetical protein OIV19_20460 [Brucella sp. HL-2]|nr:hypothetical protein [Brucella sp. HL-2]MCV9909975.1 hypothetical protein [Brucella sp. HL-2]
MRQWLVKLVVLVMVGLPVEEASSDSLAYGADGAGRFIDFFQSVVKKQTINHESRVWRWPATIETCIYGEYNSLDKIRLESNIELIEDLTSLRFTNTLVQDIDRCPTQSLLFIRFNSENEAARRIIFDDIKYLNDITGRSYIQSFSSISSFANGNYGIGGKISSYMYMSTRNSIGLNYITDRDALNELMQKPLFQILTGIDNVDNQNGESTFLRDDLKTFAFPLSHGKLNFMDRSRRTNLCFDDAMLLRALYDEESVLSNPKAEISSFIKYISENYTKLSSDVSVIMSKDKYKSILSRKC